MCMINEALEKISTEIFQPNGIIFSRTVLFNGKVNLFVIQCRNYVRHASPGDIRVAVQFEGKIIRVILKTKVPREKFFVTKINCHLLRFYH